ESDFLSEELVKEVRFEQSFKGVDVGVTRVFSIYTQPDSLVGVSMSTKQAICEGPAEDDGPFFYLYDTLSLKLGIWLPFMQFEQAALRALNIAPT
ncbi:hypothetical protein CR513_40132, partial [Mucuna pruriens]